MEAVQAVLMATETSAQVLNALELLEEKSIIQVETLSLAEGRRFFMTTALRAFAQELLQAEAVLPDLKLRFIQYHADVFQGALDGIKGGEQKKWMERIQLEINNLRTSLAWAFEAPGDIQRALLGAQILRSIQVYWPVKGKFQEGLVWIEKALTHQEKITDLEVLSALFYLAGHYAGYQGMFEQAQTYTEEGLRLARELGKPQSICNGLIFLATVAGRQGVYKHAASLLREAIEMERTYSPEQPTHTLGVAVNNLGLVLKNLGDYEGAAALFEETLAIDQAHGNRMGQAAGLTNQGDLAILQENYPYARKCYQQALEIRQEMGDASGIIKSLTGMGSLAIAEEQFVRGAQLYAANLQLRQQMNFPIPPQTQRQFAANLDQIRAALTPEDFKTAWAAGEAMSRDKAVAYALED
jgi:tetratricopeptide (TPR) repeat protein